MKRFRILSVILSFLLLVAMLVGCGPKTVTFPDENLETAIRDALGKPAGEEITVDELANLTTLSAEGSLVIDLSDITDLSGLEYCTNLTKLDLWENDISDISPLSSLTNLTDLNLGWNQISDISPLSSLTNLTGLVLSGNEISDISPLGENSGLGEGDEVWIEENDLDLSEGSDDMVNIRTLEDRGVVVHYLIPIPTPFSLEVIPDEITPAVPGQRCVFLVVATDEGKGSSKGQPVNLSATVSGATVTIEPQAASPGLVAEVTVIPDEGTLGKTLSATIRAVRDGLQQIETATIVMWDGLLPEGILDGALEAAAWRRDLFIPWLEANYPELGITVETDWVGTYAKVLMPVVNYYLFFSEEWEMGLVFHVMIPPDDWILIYLRHRFTESNPSYAFTISSEAAQGEPYPIDLEAAQSHPFYQDLTQVWR